MGNKKKGEAEIGEKKKGGKRTFAADLPVRNAKRRWESREEGRKNMVFD